MRHHTAVSSPVQSPAEQPALDPDGWPPEPPPTEAELDRLYVEEMERRGQPPVILAPFEPQPLPELRPVTRKVRGIDPATWAGVPGFPASPDPKPAA